MSVLEVRELSIGLPRGSDRRVKLRRVAPDGHVVEKDARLQDIVQANDVIYVKESIF